MKPGLVWHSHPLQDLLTFHVFFVENIHLGIWKKSSQKFFLQLQAISETKTKRQELWSLVVTDQAGSIDLANY